MNPIVELEQLTELFPETEHRPLYRQARHIAREATPEPYHRMLVHEHHMTVTMESYHDCRVEVEVLESRFENDLYCRKILLKNSSTKDVVQFGIVRFNFDFVSPAVRREIESQKIPLGRVLIQHNVLRHIDLGALLKLKAGPRLAECFAVPAGTVTFGRLATIFCNRQPAVDLLEISAPLEGNAKTNDTTE